MKGKLLFVVGLATGYVLGTRAGRERYEQIRSAAERVWNQPTVQQGVDTVKDFALSRVGDVSEKVLDGTKKLVRQATKAASSVQEAASEGAAEAKAPASTTSKPAAKKPAAKASTAKSSTAKSSSAKAGSKSSTSKASSAGSDD
ncbi:YtxH domain-containing protein [Agromyces sp. SYSU T00194]|uniref:YtxH domain-containing protein n=1 Tax=Agromyces chitinivorans TaxID=3158560 RepID=UPI003399CF31